MASKKKLRKQIKRLMKHADTAAQETDDLWDRILMLERYEDKVEKLLRRVKRMEQRTAHDTSY